MENEVKEPAPKYNYISPDEYLELERTSEEKHEYFDGQIFAMSGASLQHNRIERNLVSNLGNFLAGKNCEVLPGHMRVSSPSRESYTYPDAIIVCGTPQLEDNKFDTLTNPSVVFEILSSSSTRTIDEGRKFMFYVRIPSLTEYIMIDSQKRFIRVARKQENDAWKFEDITNANTDLYIKTIDHVISLDDIYHKTRL